MSTGHGAMRVACPVCFAREGKLCTKHDGTTMLRCHRERHDKAARVDTLKAYRQAKGAR